MNEVYVPRPTAIKLYTPQIICRPYTVHFNYRHTKFSGSYPAQRTAHWNPACKLQQSKLLRKITRNARTLHAEEINWKLL